MQCISACLWSQTLQTNATLPISYSNTCLFAKIHFFGTWTATELNQLCLLRGIRQVYSEELNSGIVDVCIAQWKCHLHKWQTAIFELKHSHRLRNSINIKQLVLSPPLLNVNGLYLDSSQWIYVLVYIVCGTKSTFLNHCNLFSCNKPVVVWGQ